MIKEAIDRIVELTSPKTYNINGKAYAERELVEFPSPAAQPQTLLLHTLSGLATYINAGVDDPDDSMSPLVVVVSGPTNAVACSKIYGDFKQRDNLAAAEPYLPKGFAFGQYMDVESFIVRVQTCFVQDETTRKLLQVVGNMQGSSVGTVVDDGVSQTVSSRRGLAKLETVALENPITLRPYRTFQEIEQPASRFIVRLQGDGESMPRVALFESEDQQWKIEAVRLITAYLAERVTVPIFA